MRLFVLFAFLAAAWPLAASAAEPANARAAYVERRGLVESDAQCRLFAPEMRSALQAGVAQARGALLRAGWSSAQVRELDQIVVAAARSRACGDQRTAASAANASAAFASWINASAMDFPGWERTWTARRLAASDGWRLRQPIAAPVAASFGVRERNGAQELALLVPLGRRQAQPTSARALMRDAARGGGAEVSLPQRMAFGLQAGLPAPNLARSFQSSRFITRLDGGKAEALFVFPDDAFRNLVALDPRETVEIRLSYGSVEQVLLVEVGDVGAARSFLTIRPHRPSAQATSLSQARRPAAN